MNPSPSHCLSVGLIVVLFLAVSSGAAPVGTAFTYEGRLEDGGAPANGIYDLQFALYDAATGGAQVGSTVTKDDVAVANGLFVVALDFGSGAFTGDARWLQIGVRPGASSDPFTPLASRQELTPTPNAIHSQAAATAAAAPWSGITGKPADLSTSHAVCGGETCVVAGSGQALSCLSTNCSAYALSGATPSSNIACGDSSGTCVVAGSGQVLACLSTNCSAHALSGATPSSHTACSNSLTGSGTCVVAGSGQVLACLSTNCSAHALSGGIP